jgi:ribosomal protein S18 acetylase RimI-like enzyme
LSKNIRLARIEDKKKILSVIGSYRHQWDKDFAKRYYDDYFNTNTGLSKRDRVYVLTDDEELLGVIGCCPDYYESDHNYWLGWFYIHSQYKKRGYGRQLLDHVIEEMKKLNINKPKDKKVKKLFVDTSSDETYNRALKLYLKRGFKKVAQIKDYYGKGEHQIILSINI